MLDVEVVSTWEKRTEDLDDYELELVKKDRREFIQFCVEKQAAQMEIEPEEVTDEMVMEDIECIDRWGFEMIRDPYSLRTEVRVIAGGYDYYDYCD